MKAYRITPGKNLDAWHMTDEQLPPTGAFDVKVRVHAAALNYRDLMVAGGYYPGVTGTPIALGDGAGEVIETGAHVTRFKVGDRVARIYYDRWREGSLSADKVAITPGASSSGTLAEEIVASEELFVHAPAHLSYEEIATLGCAGVTAWNAIFVEGRARPGGTVLGLGTGGVSIIGLQLARAAGMRTIVTSSSDEKLERAKRLGVDHLINYKVTPDWQAEVLSLTDGRGADVVLEVGGNDTLNRSVAAVANGGAVVLIGGVSGFSAPLDLAPVLMGNKRLIGVTVGSRDLFDELNRFVQSSGLQPSVGHTFRFDEAREALAYLQSGKHFGKIVITVR